MVSVLDSGAEGPESKSQLSRRANSQSRRCQVTVLGKLFTHIVPLFTKQRIIIIIIIIIINRLV